MLFVFSFARSLCCSTLVCVWRLWRVDRESVVFFTFTLILLFSFLWFLLSAKNARERRPRKVTRTILFFTLFTLFSIFISVVLTLSLMLLYRGGGEKLHERFSFFPSLTLASPFSLSFLHCRCYTLKGRRRKETREILTFNSRLFPPSRIFFPFLYHFRFLFYMSLHHS